VLASGRGAVVELRIPWALLTFADPSSHRLWDVREGSAPGTRRAGAIRISVAPSGGAASAARAYGWRGWNRVTWRERRKAGWPAVRRAMRVTAG
jgi:hypothetical protein